MNALDAFSPISGKHLAIRPSGRQKGSLFAYLLLPALMHGKDAD